MKISEIDIIVSTKNQWDRLHAELLYVIPPENVMKLEIGGRSIKPSPALRNAILESIKAEIIACQTQLQLFGVHDFEGKGMDK